jgi:hypothetical protein
MSSVLAQQCPVSMPEVSCYATVDERVTDEWPVIRPEPSKSRIPVAKPTSRS